MAGSLRRIRCSVRRSADPLDITAADAMQACSGRTPGTGYRDDGSASGEPGVDVAPPASGDVHYTYTYDVPWDAAHRFPPNVLPSARPYVSDCTTQTVTVPRRVDPQQTADIHVIRCY